VCGERLGVLAGGHLFNSDVWQFEVEASCRDRCYLRQCRVLDDGDRPVRGLTSMTLDDVLHLLQVEPRHACEEPGGLIEILGVLAKDGDREGVTILDQNFSVAVEQDPTRRAQGERALMVVLRHLLVFLVLSNLQDPETHGERSKRHNHGDLECDQSLADSPAIFTRGHELAL
jgi:hypothetical protein